MADPPGLGQTSTSRHFAISSLEEARSYADSANPIFGQVLAAYFGGVRDEVTERLLGVGG